MREFTTLGVILGYRYEHSPVMIYDGQSYSANDYINYVPSSRAGCLAPHAWLHDGSSLYDHFGQGFTLLISDKVNPAQIDDFLAIAKRVGVPIKILQPTESAIGQLYPKRFTFIRPDQHVAWRDDNLPHRYNKFFVQNHRTTVKWV
jgi:hypothetical protein